MLHLDHKCKCSIIYFIKIMTQYNAKKKACNNKFTIDLHKLCEF